MSFGPEQEQLLRWRLLGATSPEEDDEVDGFLKASENEQEMLLLAEEDLIDDYARNVLTDEERELFERNFLNTDQRLQKLGIAAAAVRYAGRRHEQEQNEAKNQPAISQPLRPAEVDLIDAWRRFFTEAWWKYAIGAAAAIGIGLCIWQLIWLPWNEGTQLTIVDQELNQAYQTSRPLEFRITGFDYAPFDKTMGSSPIEETSSNYVALDRAKRITLDLQKQRPNAATQHALGKLYLADKKFENAEEALREALGNDPDNPRIQTDLGATLFERWRGLKTDAPEKEKLLRQSISFFTGALSLAPQLNEARFNLALCYQLSDQDQAAREQWRAYLAVEQNKKWRKEAESYINRLRN